MGYRVFVIEKASAVILADAFRSYSENKLIISAD